jgi:RNA polymerase sigma-70 factor, ECF subfamily
MKELPDDDLMRLFRNGQEAAFQELFNRHHAAVYNFSRMMLQDNLLAEDALQETFLSVVRSARKYVPQGAFRTWLMRIARNRCLNMLACQHTRRAGLFAHVDVPANAASPVDLACAAERLALVQHALADLSDSQREAVWLYAFDSMSYEDIAQILDVPINTVKTLIHRGRAALARALEEGEGVA